jgi:hypothetical protein
MYMYVRYYFQTYRFPFTKFLSYCIITIIHIVVLVPSPFINFYSDCIISEASSHSPRTPV